MLAVRARSSPAFRAPGRPSSGAHEHLIVALAAGEDDPREAIARGREVLKDLLRALRLFGDGRVTLGALAWARVGRRPVDAAGARRGRPPARDAVVTAEQEDELRAFCNLVSRRAPHGNEVAWALRRFELGCERESAFEALTDHLLALRALLEPEGPASGLLPGRLAALCATPEQRVELTERARQALALEREVMTGSDAGARRPPAGARAGAGRPSARAAQGRHLRPSRRRPRRRRGSAAARRSRASRARGARAPAMLAQHLSRRATRRSGPVPGDPGRLHLGAATTIGACPARPRTGARPSPGRV